MHLTARVEADLSRFCLLGLRCRRLDGLNLLLRQGQSTRDGVRTSRGKVHQRVNPIPEERKRMLIFIPESQGNLKKKESYAAVSLT